MRTIVIPDLHNRISWVEPYLAKKPHDEVVFLGDYFDDFGDTVAKATATAEWLKSSVTKPNRIHLFGNHDLSYAFQTVDRAYRFRVSWMMCSGNTGEKFKAIRKVLSAKDWKQLKLLHLTQGWHLSHAGLSEFHFSHPVFGYEKAEEKCDEALENARGGIYNPILGCGTYRGGNEQVGGILWQDWREFKPIEGINQIVGHTPNLEAGVRDAHFYKGSLATSLNYCIDVHSRYVGIIENGEFKTEYVDPFLKVAEDK